MTKKRKKTQKQQIEQVSDQGRRMLPVLLLVIVLVSFAVYFNTLFNDFVHDDVDQVVNNPWIKDITKIPAMFTTSVWSFQGYNANYYRPMMHVIYLFSYLMFGLNPWGFHLVNIVLHAGASVMVYLVIARLLGGPLSFTSPAFLSAILFAVHPIHTEVVAWVACLPELAFSLLYLLSFYLYIKSTEGTEFRKGIFVLSLISFFFSALFKEPALTLPIILLAFDYLKKKELSSINVRRYIPYVVIIIVYLLARFHALGDFAPRHRHAELNGYEYFINAFPLFAGYLAKLVLPTNLNVHHVLHPVSSLLDAKALIALVVSITFLFFWYLSFKKKSVSFLAFSIIILPLLPVLYIPALGENSFAERYLYLPSVGFVMLLAMLFMRVMKGSKKGTTIVLTSVLVLTCLYSAGTMIRNTVWKNDIRLWSDSVQKEPDGATPHNSLGVAYYRKGLYDEAISQHLIARDLDPGRSGTYNYLGIAYLAKGMNKEAITYFRKSLQADPNMLDAHNNLGIAYGSTGQWAKAIEHFKAAVALAPGFSDLHHNLGVTYLNSGSVDQAIEQFREALKLAPDAVKTHRNLARAYQMKGLTDKAEEHWKKALALEGRR